EKLLRMFAKAAVAGSTDIKTAGSTIIGVMNAWKMPVSEVGHALDVQFQIIKEGKIEYDELSRSLGRSVPSAVRAGQSFEELGGLVAYLTRQNLTASQAVTSAGRALDLFSNTKVGDRLK